MYHELLYQVFLTDVSAGACLVMVLGASIIYIAVASAVFMLFPLLAQPLFPSRIIHR